MKDLISRQAAIDALGEKPIAWERGEYEEGLQTQWESDVEAIKALPPAQPEPVRRGKWLDSETFKRPWFRHHVFECSVCRNTLDMDGVNAGRGDANYCPNCGARMDAE